LDRRPALAAVLARPADAEPAVRAEPAERLRVERAATLRFAELGLVFGRDDPREVRAELVAEPLLLRRVVDVHAYSFNLNAAPMGISGRNAVVTGGASGIGRAIVLRLARDGADVALIDLDRAAAGAVAAEVAALGRRAVAAEADVAD